MDVIISFIESIVTSLSTIVDILITLIEDSLFMAELALSFIAQIPDLLAFLPPSVSIMFGAGFTASVIFIVGRFL